MTVTYVGGMTLGDAMPGVVGPLVAALGDVQAKIAACASFAVSITPPSITADIQANAQILANLQLALSVGIEPPSIEAQFAIMADAVMLLQAQLQVFQNLFDLLRAELHVYAYSGQCDALGGEFTTELAAGVPGGAGTDLANALLLITTVSGMWAKIAQVFKTTP